MAIPVLSSLRYGRPATCKEDRTVRRNFRPQGTTLIAKIESSGSLVRRGRPMQTLRNPTTRAAHCGALMRDDMSWQVERNPDIELLSSA
jgi:hypothetical protein